MNNLDVPIRDFTFGDFIKSARIGKGLRQRDVAERAGVEQAYLSKVERDEREPSLSIALRICDVLGLDINDFAKRHI